MSTRPNRAKVLATMASFAVLLVISRNVERSVANLGRHLGAAVPTCQAERSAFTGKTTSYRTADARRGTRDDDNSPLSIA